MASFQINQASFWILVVSAAGIILICNVIVSLVKKLRHARQMAAFPSAPSHWFTGHLNQIKKHDGAALQFFLRCATEFKKCFVVSRGALYPSLVVCHPDTIKVMQSSGAPKGANYRFFQAFIGDGLIASNGDKWFKMRRLLTPAFHFEVLRSYLKVFQESTNVLLDKWSAHECDEVELFHFISLLTLDSIFKCALSYQSNCQTEEKKNPYIKAVSESCDAIMSRIANPILHIDAIYQMTAAGKQYAKNCELARGKAKEIIRERRATLQDNAEQENLGKKKRLDFLDILLSARDERGEGLTEEEIISEVMTFMFAGHDTTASSISWTLYNLARFTEHQEKCREEIEEVFGDREEFEWNDLNKLKYLHMCIKESNRLYSVVPSVSRLLDKPYEIDGKVVPEGTWVISHLFSLHRNPHVWEDPEKYDPLRFTNENMKAKSPFAYVPFSAGPRNCIGQAFALAEVKTTVAMILRKFELSVPAHNIIPDEDLQHHVILRAKNGIKVKLSPRS